MKNPNTSHGHAVHRSKNLLLKDNLAWYSDESFEKKVAHACGTVLKLMSSGEQEREQNGRDGMINKYK